ncbi:MAG: heavy-metal-associated domain-containing protein [Actinobacteria bacterium]|nr:heavy-metal-associated domain-containing protein [Actinomycetota bacterium]
MPNAPAASRTYTVRGMTCQHCVASVREEVERVAGVRDVDVDLATGRLTVAGEDVDDGAVVAAVAEAGYETSTGQ